jgi:hypothetical protein
MLGRKWKLADWIGEKMEEGKEKYDWEEEEEILERINAPGIGKESKIRMHHVKARKRLGRSYNTSETMSVLPCSGSDMPKAVQSTFQILSGQTLSEENQWTSGKYSPPCSYRDLCQRMLAAWEGLRSDSPEERNPGGSKTLAIGTLHGTLQQRQPLSSSPIEKRNLPSIPRSCSRSSHSKIQSIMPKLSFMMMPLENRLEEGRVDHYSTPKSMQSLTRLSCIPTAWSTQLTEAMEVAGGNSVIDSMENSDVKIQTALTSTNVEHARIWTMDKPVVQRAELKERGLRPKYLRYNRWNVEGGAIPGAVEWSEQAEVLP